MTTNDRHHARLRLDVPSLALLLLGLMSGMLALWLITEAQVTALVMIPSVVAATVGATHLMKREAPRSNLARTNRRTR